MEKKSQHMKTLERTGPEDISDTKYEKHKSGFTKKYLDLKTIRLNLVVSKIS